MVNPASSTPPKRIVLRANRETLALVLAASAATFTLSYAIHARPPESAVTDSSEAQTEAQQDWAGHLADMSTDPTPTASFEPLTSASLVVPKSALALPAPMVRKPRLCDPSTCPAKVPVPISVMREKSSHFEMVEREAHRNGSLLSKLNPLNHLPSMSTLGKPFAVAGNTISGWIDRF